MTASRHNNKTIRKKRARRVGLMLATVFLMIFFIGKLISDPEESVAEESIHPVAAKVAEQSIIQDTVQPEKQNRPDGKPMGKVVYLTFDDGPSTLTNQFLDVLREQDVKATFFMQGSNLLKTNLQENVKRATKEGHYVGAHSMTHIYEKLYDNEQFVPEMNETLSLIQEITGTNPKLVRPPYGSAPGLESEQIRNEIVEAGIKIWDWTIDSNDWGLQDNPSQIVENIIKGTKNDVEVVLMHEKSQTLQVLPEIISFYREKGYVFGVYNDADHFNLNFYQDKYL